MDKDEIIKKIYSEYLEEGASYNLYEKLFDAGMEYAIRKDEVQTITKKVEEPKYTWGHYVEKN